MIAIAALIGLAFLGNGIAGATGAGIALLLPYIVYMAHGVWEMSREMSRETTKKTLRHRFNIWLDAQPGKRQRRKREREERKEAERRYTEYRRQG